jgi:DNA-binding transcriptional regulator YiaG
VNAPATYDPSAPASYDTSVHTLFDLTFVRTLSGAQRRRIRDDANLSRAALARTLGCTESAIRAWEYGTRNPSGSLGERYGRLLITLAHRYDTKGGRP